MATPPPPPIPPNYKPIYPVIERRLINERGYSIKKCRNTFEDYLRVQKEELGKIDMDVLHWAAEADTWEHYCKL